MKSTKVDMVYLWVDGEDPKWIERRSKYSSDVQSGRAEAVSECRFLDNDELRYSIRSLEQNAPWINHIFIVTDGQCPEWLDRDNPKVTIVDHTEILPSEVLPLYNSAAIEWGLANIPELSEHFIYGNDDMLILRPVDKEFFFNEQGNPRVMLRRRTLLYYKYKKHSNYAQTCYRSIRRIKRDFGQLYAMTPHHCIDAYRKSLFRECVGRYQNDIDRTLTSRFRQNSDVQRSLANLYSLAVGKGELVWVGKFNGLSSFGAKIKAFFKGEYNYLSAHLPVTCKNYKAVIQKKRPSLLCLNDNHHTAMSDRLRAKEFLKELFPNPSSVEKY